ncbi:MAG: nucleotide exchange factor GrpE [Acidobacteriota bacterium]
MSSSPDRKAATGKKPAHPKERELLKQVDELAGRLQEKEDQLLRTLADFDNYRKRVAKEGADIGKAGKKALLLGLLDVLESFRLAFLSEAVRNQVDTYHGFRGIQRQLEQLLDQHEIVSFDSVGNAFDPAFHEAVDTEFSAKYPAGYVSHQLQPGYLWKGKVLRPAKVIVARDDSAQQHHVDHRV